MEIVSTTHCSGLRYTGSPNSKRISPGTPKRLKYPLGRRKVLECPSGDRESGGIGWGGVF